LVEKMLKGRGEGGGGSSFGFPAVDNYPVFPPGRTCRSCYGLRDVTALDLCREDILEAVERFKKAYGK